MISFQDLLQQLASEYDALEQRLKKAEQHNEILRSEIAIGHEEAKSATERWQQEAPNSNPISTRRQVSFEPSVQVNEEEVGTDVDDGCDDEVRPFTPASCLTVASINTSDQDVVRNQRELELRDLYSISDEELRFMRPRVFDLEDALQELERKQRDEKRHEAFRAAIMTNEELKVQSCSGGIMHPQSNRRLAWDLWGLVLVGYDLIVTPLDLLVREESSWMRTVGWIINAFWICDIVVNFFTGYYKGGEVIRQRHKIAVNYSRSWLMFDVLIVAPDWVELIMGMLTLGHLRLLKAIRMIRLVRAVKLTRLMGNIDGKVQSPLFITLRCFILITGVIFVFMHNVACAWTLIGESDGGWLEELGMKSSPATERYVVAMHFALALIQGSSWPILSLTISERLFSICILPAAFLSAAALIGCAAHVAIETQKSLNNFALQHLALRAFARRYKVDTLLYSRVKHFINNQALQTDAAEREHAFLAILPQGLKWDLLSQAYEGSIIRHPLFKFLRSGYPSCMRELCGEMTNETIDPGDLVFAQGDSCEVMRFVMGGRLMYLHGRHIEDMSVLDLHLNRGLTRHATSAVSGSHATSFSGSRSATSTPTDMLSGAEGRYTFGELQRAQFLSRGRFVSEAVLWTVWEHMGDLSAVVRSGTCVLTANTFAKVVRQHPCAHWMSVMYARQFIIRINERIMSDVFQPPRVRQWEPEAMEVAEQEGKDLPFEDELPPHISVKVARACVMLAQEVARHGLDENRPHHGFTIVIGLSRALQKCGKAGFNPFEGHHLCVLDPGVTDLMRRNAFHTDGAIAVDGITGKVIASGWFVADISAGGSEGGARSRSAKAVAQQGNGCYVIKCSEDSRGKLIIHLYKKTVVFNSPLKPAEQHEEQLKIEQI